MFHFLLIFRVAFEFKPSCPILTDPYNLRYRTSKLLVKLASIEELNSQIDTGLVLSAVLVEYFVVCVALITTIGALVVAIARLFEVSDSLLVEQHATELRSTRVCGLFVRSPLHFLCL